MLDAFFGFCQSASKDDLTLKIKEWTHKIFGISTCSFIFVEGGKLIDHNLYKKFDFLL